MLGTGIVMGVLDIGIDMKGDGGGKTVLDAFLRAGSGLRSTGC